MSRAKLISPITKQGLQKKRVAAYCRVSSNSADQLNSYANQIRVYTKLLNSKQEWQMVEIFADEGLSGTKADNRDEFQRMIHMCELHQIDLIITKSVARFARNVKESLEYVRKLKLLGVGVQFEKEGINTLAMGDEMLLNTFTAIAQEESQAISQNQRLSIVKRMELGEYVDSNAPYGYRLENKVLAIYEPEAKIVRWIYHIYLQGWSTSEIARHMTEQGIPTKSGKETWTSAKIKYILTNERYIGDCNYQKTYRDTTVPFRQFKNRGQEDMYYAKGTHTPLLDREIFNKVQALLEKRQKQFNQTESLNVYPLTSRIRCAECGSIYRRKIRNGVPKWVCKNHLEDSKLCPSNYCSEARIYDALASMVNKLRFGEEDILGQVISKLEVAVFEHKRNNKAAGTVSQSIAEINAKILMLDQLRAKGYLAPEVHQAQTIELRSQLGKLKSERSDLFETRILGMLEDVKKLRTLLQEVEAPLETINEQLLLDVVKELVITKKGEMSVTVLGNLTFQEQL